MDIGQRLTGLRKRDGYTQEDVARKLQVSSTTVTRWENDYKLPGMNNLIELSKLFHVPLNYLVGFDNKKSIVVDGLTKNQQNILNTIILEFQSSKKKFNGLTQRQHDILSELMKEFRG